MKMMAFKIEVTFVKRLKKIVKNQKQARRAVAVCSSQMKFERKRFEF